MASSKKITDLKALKKVIKKANEERKKEEEERKRAEKQSISDRDLFLKSIGDVTPIDNASLLCFHRPNRFRCRGWRMKNGLSWNRFPMSSVWKACLKRMTP